MSNFDTDTITRIQGDVAALIEASAADDASSDDIVNAAIAIGDAICKLVPSEVPLPGGYKKVVHGNDNYGYCRFLVVPSGEVNEYGIPDEEIVNCHVTGHLYDQFNMPYLVATSRETAIRFARDIEGGLLAEIATFCDARKNEAAKAKAALDAAAASLEVAS